MRAWQRTPAAPPTRGSRAVPLRPPALPSPRRRYTEAARVEAGILADVNAADGSGESLCVRFERAFDWGGHLCLVFEPLGPSLYDFVSAERRAEPAARPPPLRGARHRRAASPPQVKANEYRPPPLYCVQAFADQLLRAVAFLHGMRLIHTDLKLENVLLVSRAPFVPSTKITSVRRQAGARVLAPAATDIKLIDFGGATYDWEHKSAVINTRQYRAPEVILNMGWSMPSDVWSAGCILMELYTGELLFQTVRGGRGRGRRRPVPASAGRHPPARPRPPARPPPCSTTTPSTSR